jgi:putative sugar O-methyltransferase
MRISRWLNRLALRIAPSPDRNVSTMLPAGAAEYLRYDNPRLQELRNRYHNHPATRHSLWSNDYLRRELRLEYFRSDNAYLYQQRYSSNASYALTTNYVMSHDDLGLLGRLRDDELFGNFLVNFDDDLFVSRDLLDSVLEIDFINRELNLRNLSNLRILDIGAGYGRLAHRLVQALPNIERVFCADAIPESTFISEFYLRFRGVEQKAKVIPLDEIEQALTNRPVDLVTNVHSFAECTCESISWWLDLIAAHQVRFLFIVANGEELGSTEADNTNIDYLPAVVQRGYHLKTKQAKYSDSPSVQKYGLYPTYYYLFERR